MKIKRFANIVASVLLMFCFIVCSNSCGYRESPTEYEDETISQETKIDDDESDNSKVTSVTEETTNVITTTDKISKRFNSINQVEIEKLDYKKD